MVVCLCQGVSDKRIRACIAEGARSRAEVTAACGAGDGCGTCHSTIKTLIVECRREVVARPDPPYAEQQAASSAVA
jgi:bacterioferritin-associated ferredoxin